MGYDAWKTLFGAYEFIATAVPPGQSRTAQLLRNPDWQLLRSRLAGELEELAGVLDGTHVHKGLPEDLILEASQVCYWAFVIAVANSSPFDELFPAGETRVREAGELAHEIRDLAASIAGARAVAPGPGELSAAFAAALGSCLAAGIDPPEPARYDLDQMRGKRYMQAYFNTHGPLIDAP